MAQRLDIEAEMIPPPIGSTLAVRMPCGQEALAEVLSHLRGDFGRGSLNGLRVRWLPANGTFIKGYKICWGKRAETIEGTLPFPPDPKEEMYGTIQMGDYCLYQKG